MECTVSYISELITEANIRQFCRVIKGVLIKIFKTVSEIYTFKVLTVCESIIFQFFKAVRQLHRHKGAALAESSVFYQFKSVTENDIFQTVTIAESIFADSLYTLSELNSFKLFESLKRKCRYLCYIIAEFDGLHRLHKCELCLIKSNHRYSVDIVRNNDIRQRPVIEPYKSCFTVADLIEDTVLLDSCILSFFRCVYSGDVACVSCDRICSPNEHKSCNSCNDFFDFHSLFSFLYH